MECLVLILTRLIPVRGFFLVFRCYFCVIWGSCVMCVIDGISSKRYIDYCSGLVPWCRCGVSCFGELVLCGFLFLSGMYNICFSDSSRFCLLYMFDFDLSSIVILLTAI